MELFECPKHAGHLKLLPTTCAKMWWRARKAKNYEMLYPCRHCPIGAKHAGCEQVKTRLAVDRFCVRCHRPSQRYIHGRICVSCYNRGLEWKKGKNAKGTKPIHIPALYTDHVCIWQNGKYELIVVDEVSDRLESLLTVARNRGQKTIFVRQGQPFTPEAVCSEQ